MGHEMVGLRQAAGGQMTIPRMVGVLLCLVAVSLAVVVMRVEQSRISWRTQQMQFDQARLRRELWTQETELARLRAPAMVRERAVRLGLQINEAVSQGSSPRQR